MLRTISPVNITPKRGFFHTFAEKKQFFLDITASAVYLKADFTSKTRSFV